MTDNEHEQQSSHSAAPTDLRVVSVGNSFTVEHVTAIRDELLQAFEAVNTVTLDLGSAERVDLAGVHTLYAAEKEAAKQGKTLRLHGTLNENVAHILVVGGFCRTTPTKARDLPEYLLEFG